MPITAYALALVAAFLSAAATILIRQGLRSGAAYTGFWINLAVGTIGLWAGVLLTGGPGHVSVLGVALFVLAGLVGTAGGRLLRFVSIERVGASVSAAMFNLNPLISSGLAILLLGERVTLPVIAGTVIIVAGTVQLSIGSRRLGVSPRQLALPLLSATCFGVVAILRKLGLDQMSAVMGSAINVSAALVAFSALLLAWGQPGTAVCRGSALGYFIAAGVAENTAVFLNVLALDFGRVSVVAPLYGTAPIFVLFLSFFFLRGVEVLSARVVAGTVMIVLGVYLITALPGH